MALFHFTVNQMKRNEGQPVITSAAYRSGERLYSECYSKYSDYTRKGGVVCSGILLPSHVPPEFADRQTLWSAIEQAEREKKAQLAHSFEIALQNEFTIEENIALTRQFLSDNFMSRGMTAGVAFHEKETEDGGIPNLHFHFPCPMRPVNPDGTWGSKQHRVYRLDGDGNRIRDQNGKLLSDAVPTTDWGSPETLEHWRKARADVYGAKFEKKGLDVRIDHRSYLRQGADLLPTVHEGTTARAVEKKGIRTEKGGFNRWIKTINAVIRDIRKKIALLSDWTKEIKAEPAKPQTLDLALLLRVYYSKRNVGACSQKGKISNLKKMDETFNCLRENGIYTLEDLESRVESYHIKADNLKTTMGAENARMKAIRNLSDDSNTFQRLKSAYEGLQKIRFDKPGAAYRAEHEAELKQFYVTRRRLTAELPNGKMNMKKLSEEYNTLVQTHTTIHEQFKSIREDLQRLWKIKSCADTAARFTGHTEEQMLQNQPQARYKKEDISL